jgi:tRNA (mo5U34)-methyltransferase
MTRATSELEERILSRRWFYNFRLPSGRVTECYLPSDVVPIHETREQMMFQALEPVFGGRWDHVTAVDLACHEGWFAHKLAQRGCRSVLGIDARQEHVTNATLIRDALGLANLDYRAGNLEIAQPGSLGSFDLCLLFGILYHVENLVGVLRLARSATRRVCLIETQLGPDIASGIDWGSYRSYKDLCGTIVIVDETEEIAAVNREANVSTISLVPSLRALLFLLKAVGFARAEVVKPPPGAYEQLAQGKRAVVAAFPAAS